MALSRKRGDFDRAGTIFPSEDEGGHEDYLVSFIRTLNYHYLKTDRRTGTVTAIMPGQIVKWPFNQAYPAAMEVLIQELERLTDQIPIDPDTAILGGDVPQWRADRQAWKERLRHYRAVQNDAMKPEFEGGSPLGPDLDPPIAFSEMDRQYIDEVAMPLLLGFFPGVEGQRPPDAATPISLAYQAQVIDEHMVRSIKQLGAEIKAGIVKAAQITLGIGALALVALGVYGVVELAKAYKR